MKNFEKPLDQMKIGELERAYEQMTRNFRPEDCAVLFETPGPLSEDPLVRPKQEVYRQLIALKVKEAGFLGDLVKSGHAVKVAGGTLCHGAALIPNR